MPALTTSVNHSAKLFGSVQVVMMATSNTVLLLPLLLLPAQVCHESCDALHAASLQRIARWPAGGLCTSNVAACNQLVTHLVTSQAGLSASRFTILAEVELCVMTHVPAYHVIVCILVDSVLCVMTHVSAKGFLTHVKHVAVRLFTVCLACR